MSFRRGIPTGVLSGPGHCKKYLKAGDVLPDKKGFSFFKWYNERSDDANGAYPNTLLNSPFNKSVSIITTPPLPSKIMHVMYMYACVYMLVHCVHPDV